MCIRDRINEVLNEKPLSESSVNNIPKDNGITLEHVSYSYDGKKDVYKRQALHRQNRTYWQDNKYHNNLSFGLKIPLNQELHQAFRQLSFPTNMYLPSEKQNHQAV